MKTNTYGLHRPALSAPLPDSRDAGVVLVIALVLLVVIAISSVVAFRLATRSSVIANNAREKLLAYQAAQQVQEHCITHVENQVQPIPSSNSNNYWQDIKNWSQESPDGSYILDHLQDDQMNTQLGYTSDAMSSHPEMRPRCMIEKVSSQSAVDGAAVDKDAYRITSRGFSPDYTEDSNGHPESGAQVWLQVTISCNLGKKWKGRDTLNIVGPSQCWKLADN